MSIVVVIRNNRHLTPKVFRTYSPKSKQPVSEDHRLSQESLQKSPFRENVISYSVLPGIDQINRRTKQIDNGLIGKREKD